MTHGIDTDFLVAAEIQDHPFHREADALLQSLLADGHDLALAPQTLAEFIHIVTDGKRMPQPLTMAEAISRAEALVAGCGGGAGVSRWPGGVGFLVVANAPPIGQEAIVGYDTGGDISQRRGEADRDQQ
jgi:predicted nucleic acid-binding protein